MHKQKQDFDAIVVGSGGGGLACALSLARADKTVLVLEQHEVPGGCCHTFQLEGHRFSPGLHYVGDLHEGGQFRAILDGLEISQHLTFIEMNPNGFDHVICGENRFDVPKGKRRLIDRLKERFPREKQHIEDYFQKVDNMIRACFAFEKARSLGPVQRALKLVGLVHPMLTEGFRSLGYQLDKHFQDPFLKAILGIQCGDYALPPAKVPFVVHASLMNHYFEGAYFPENGGVAIPRAFLREIKARQGQLRLRTRVKKILTKKVGGKATAYGVELESGEKIYSSIVVSNADAPTTYLNLVGTDYLSKSMKKRLAKTKMSLACMNLFLAIDTDLTKFGIDSGNVWWSETNDLDPFVTNEDPIGQGIHGLFITSQSLRDPAHRKIGADTLEAIAFCPYELFENTDDYQALKEALTKAMISKLDSLFPGIAKHISFQALGTPLTHEHYINAARGNIYGTEKSMKEILKPFPLKTEVDGLFHCGASTTSHGVAGVIYSGILCAEQILGRGQKEFLSGKTYPLEIKQAQ